MMETCLKAEAYTQPIVDIAEFEPLIADHTLITGGHFLIGANSLPQLNEGTITSFRQAAQLFASGRQRNLQVHLGLFVNDIGMTCESTNHCSIIKPNFSKDDFKLPEAYQAILREYDIPESQLQLFWEKQVRNRGSQLFKQWKKQTDRLEKDEIGYWLLDPEVYGRILLCRRSGIPTCPLIVAAFICEQQRQGFTNSLNMHYIGLDNMGNISNHFVIEKGKRVAELLASNVAMKNVYFTDQNVLVNF